MSDYNPYSAFPLDIFDENKRLQAVAPYRQIDTYDIEPFAELLQTISALFAMPMCGIALVEADTVRVGLNYGLSQPVNIVNRWQTLCSVVIMQQSPVVFEDLQEDMGDILDPSLLLALDIRFYAGQALRTAEGFALGALCVMDTEKHLFGAPEKQLLARLAKLTTSLLDLRLQVLQQDGLAPLLWADITSSLSPVLHRLMALAAPYQAELHTARIEFLLLPPPTLAVILQELTGLQEVIRRTSQAL